jgi:hypothetical protein
MVQKVACAKRCREGIPSLDIAGTKEPTRIEVARINARDHLLATKLRYTTTAASRSTINATLSQATRRAHIWERVFFGWRYYVF